MQEREARLFVTLHVSIAGVIIQNSGIRLFYEFSNYKGLNCLDCLHIVLLKHFLNISHVCAGRGWWVVRRPMPF